MAGSASVEAEDEFVEVALQMLPSQSVIDAERPGLGVGEDAMGPGQDEMRGHVSDDVGIVSDARGARVGRPPVGLDRGARRDIGGDKAVQRSGGEVLDRGQANASGRIVFNLDGGGDEHFALARAAAAAGDRIGLGSQRNFGFVDFDQAGKRRTAGRDHGASQFGAQQPRRLVGAEPELLLQLQRRDAIGMGRHEIGGPEPNDQRQLRAVQDRAGRHRGLPAAGGALMGESFAAMRPSLGVPAGGTSKAGRPSGRKKPSRTSVVVGKSALKLDERGRKIGHRVTSKRRNVRVLFLHRYRQFVTTLRRPGP